MSQHLPIEETDLYRKSEDLADTVWEIVDKWRAFHQDTVGKQLVRAADSIGANLVEGDGRYSDRDSLHFFVIARGSARETAHWLRRCLRRNLIQKLIAEDLLRQVEFILKSLNGLINCRRNRGKAVGESKALYDTAFDSRTQHSTPNTQLLPDPEESPG
jgi:four helix bundle protein